MFSTTQVLKAVGMDDLLRINGYRIIRNGNSTLLYRDNGHSNNTQLLTEEDPGGEKREQAERLLFALVGLLPLICGLVFLGLSCYNRVQKCRKYIRDRELKQYEERMLATKKAAEIKKQEKQVQDKLDKGDIGTSETCNSDKEMLIKQHSLDGSQKGSESPVETKVDIDIEDIMQSLEPKNTGAEDKAEDTDKCGGQQTDSLQGGDHENSENGNGDSLDHKSDTEEKEELESDHQRKASSGHVTFSVDEETIEAEKEKQATKSVKKRNKGQAKTITPWFQGDQTFDVPMLMYLYVFFSLPLSVEMTMGNFLYVYAMESQLKMTTIFASFLLSIFWGMMAISRIFTVMMSNCLAPNAFMVTTLTLNLVSSILLATYGDRYLSVLWLFTALFGATLGPLLPGGLTWANIYLNYTPKAISLAICLSALGATLFSWLTGLLVDFYGISAMMYVVVCMSALSLLCYVPAMRGLATRRVFNIRMRRKRDMVLSNSQRTYL